MQALKRELRCMEADARTFATGLQAALDPAQIADMKMQLEGRFRFLWGIYRAHSEVCFICLLLLLAGLKTQTHVDVGLLSHNPRLQ